MARVTINDIARISGYSKTTVSFAFNDPRRIGGATREKILAIARDLGYIPDPVARNLSLRRHGTIGLLVPDVIPLAFQNPYLAQIVRGIGEVCEHEGHSLTLIPPIRESLLDGVRSAAVDGLITIGLEPGHEIVEIIRHRHLPFVTIDGRVGGGFPVVGIDDFAAAEAMMRYVLETGHRSPAIIELTNCTDVDSSSHVKLRRAAGYRAALEATEIADSSVPRVESDATVDGGYRAARLLHDGGARPDVVVAMSDIMAIGVVRFLSSVGVRVPEDVSVVGFDDIPEASLVRPYLTTIAQPGYEKGRSAAAVLVDQVLGREAAEYTELEWRLVVRESSAARA